MFGSQSAKLNDLASVIFQITTFTHYNLQTKHQHTLLTTAALGEYLLESVCIKWNSGNIEW
jgi:hypothetical protein